jgi:ribose transport system ATP-binding protein
MVEIAKVFLAKAQVLILDEPTASLTEKETRKLFAFIAKAKADGVGIIYISHRIQEFREIAENISVLRDGRLIGTVSARDTSEKALVELMTGRAIDQIYPEIGHQPDGRTLMTLRQMHGAGFHGVDIEVRAGEVLGIAGLVGSGKSRIWRSVLGLQPIRAGTVMLNGRDVTHAATRHMLRGGVYYLPPDRKSEGLQLAATARENIKLSLLDRTDMALWHCRAAPHQGAGRQDRRTGRHSVRPDGPHCFEAFGRQPAESAVRQGIWRGTRHLHLR